MADKKLVNDSELLTAREAEIRKKHRRVLPGTIRRETDGSHAGKLTVEMKCQNGKCENVRRVASSDLFQVRCCEDCTKELRNKARRAKAKASKNGEPVAKKSKPVKASRRKGKTLPKDLDVEVAMPVTEEEVTELEESVS